MRVQLSLFLRRSLSLFQRQFLEPENCEGFSIIKERKHPLAALNRQLDPEFSIFGLSTMMERNPDTDGLKFAQRYAQARHGVIADLRMLNARFPQSEVFDNSLVLRAATVGLRFQFRVLGDRIKRENKANLGRTERQCLRKAKGQGQ